VPLRWRIMGYYYIILIRWYSSSYLCSSRHLYSCTIYGCISCRGIVTNILWLFVALIVYDDNHHIHNMLYFLRRLTTCNIQTSMAYYQHHRRYNILIFCIFVGSDARLTRTTTTFARWRRCLWFAWWRWLAWCNANRRGERNMYYRNICRSGSIRIASLSWCCSASTNDSYKCFVPRCRYASSWWCVVSPSLQHRNIIDDCCTVLMLRWFVMALLAARVLLAYATLYVYLHDRYTIAYVRG
jgi:hypothetical protein